MPVREPMRIMIAPSGFKESIDAPTVAGAIAAGVHRVMPEALIDTAPMVDGGEGSATAMARSTGGTVVPVRVDGPVGRTVPAHFGILGGPGPRTALVEMAAAAGLRLVPRDARDPGRTSTYGVGTLIRAALDEGCRRIIVGCGDSGTCDGGAGMLQALGADVLDSAGAPIGRGGYEVARATHLDVRGMDPRLRDTEIVLACNPCNILTGPKGVAEVFGPQKGADAAQVRRLGAAMDNWAALLAEHSGLDLRTAPGTGASGGLGAGAAGVLGARLSPRFDVLLDGVDLDGRLAAADLVITAEGAIDFQTPNGKVPAEVARRAKLSGKPVIALAGTIGRGAWRTYGAGIDAYTGIIAAPVDLGGAMEQAVALTTDAAERTLRLVLVGASLGAAAEQRPVAAAACPA
ncbi:glycerate kinase [Murinocardiopsis flavida]|uniref:Glycerate kinase n=1 Tax=Murinocardiopsis flavida TaxID=645275 RepID=A0A2P8CXE2_9ACTN|nr:glycerate kinase [Murinocardiopsis flavida]PSK89651.1 glycerate kinase [Murinocardiopsis flavida]